MRARWAAMLTATVAVAFTLAGPSAWAADPVTLESDYVYDAVGVMAEGDADAAQSRLEQLKEETGLDLWVVFVDEFTNPSDSASWANTTATNNGLGPSQYLLAVAVDARQYYLSGDVEGPVTEDQLIAIEQEQIQPALASDDWLGAVDAAADGLTDASGGGAGTPSASGGGWFFPVLLGIVIVGGIIFVIVWFARRRGKVGASGATAIPQANGQPQVPIEKLEQIAASALIETDDAIKTSTQELGFAAAQFGDEVTAPFAQTIEEAKKDLDEAFSLKQQLDDEVPDAAADTRAWNERIIALCEKANAALDAKAEEFDELRGLEKNAPEALARVQQERARVAAELDRAEAHLQTLASTYRAEALATVADNPGQARSRIAFADEQLAAAQQAIGAGEGGDAAVGIRAAEDAVGQAALLEDAIETLTEDLAAAEQRATALLTELDADVRAAATLPDPDGRVAATIAATTAQIESARGQLQGSGRSPIAATQALEQANQQIDAVTQGVRDAAAQAQRAQQQLGGLVLQARAQVATAEDYITARRGAVGADARTRLAEAGASLARAEALANVDPAQALPHAQRANELATQASQLAQRDVAAFAPAASGGGGGNMMGAMLGGVLINSLLGGGGGRSSGGGLFGASMGGGSRRSSGGGSFGGGMRAGSFGGGGTRARRGGGRF